MVNMRHGHRHVVGVGGTFRADLLTSLSLVCEMLASMSVLSYLNH